MTVNQVGAAAVAFSVSLLAVSGGCWWLLRRIDRAVTLPAPTRARVR